MKFIKLFIALLINIGLIYLLNIPLSPKGADGPTLPPLGDFFNPFTGFWQNAEGLGAAFFESFEIPEMKDKVTIHFDERQVPHIFANNLEDALFAHGYVEAGMRLWQMDLLTRVSSGRLAEVMGENTLKTDKLMRRRGMLYAAKNSEKIWRESPEAMRLLTAYQNGVNAWIDQLSPKDYPLEYKLLDYQPEKWTILKTALVRQYMNLTLNLRETDVEASNAMQIFGADQYEKLFPAQNPKQQPIIPPGTEWNFDPVPFPQKEENQEAIGLIQHKIDPVDEELVGSNNWAVSGKKTKSGNPILCNDPHLQLTLPSIWFEVQISLPEANGYGVSIPGLPGIVIGFNEHLAWGVTNVGTDVADWYSIDWTDETKSSYVLNGKSEATKSVIEPYRIKGQEKIVYDTVKWTRWGPVVYESANSGWKDLALRWISHDEPQKDDILGFTGLFMGKNYTDYRKALKQYTFPAQNFVFADQAGDIAITVNGRFPLKKEGQGPFVQVGNTTDNAWAGFIPMDHVPSVKNPPRGFVGSANQRSTDDTYPYYYNSAKFDQYRGRVLFDALSEMDSIEVEDMMALQLFNYSIHAKEALEQMVLQVDRNSLSDRERRVLAKLITWNHAFDKEMVEPAIFQEWWDQYYKMTFDEILVFKDSIPMLKPSKWRLIEMTEKMPNDAIFDDQQTEEIENASQMATLSLKETCKVLADKLLDPAFNWASHKNTSIMHLTKIPAFSRMNLDVGGYRASLNAISAFNGPSWRMIVELGDRTKAWGVFPGGQSGNPGSKYYDLDVDTWRTGNYHQLFFMKDAFDNSQPIAYSIEIN